MTINQEDMALWVIVIQGFFIMFYEFDVWRMNKERYEERKQWRLAKQKQKSVEIAKEKSPLPIFTNRKNATDTPADMSTAIAKSATQLDKELVTKL